MQRNLGVYDETWEHEKLILAIFVGGILLILGKCQNYTGNNVSDLRRFQIKQTIGHNCSYSSTQAFEYFIYTYANS